MKAATLNDNRTVSQLIRDISGINFSEETTPKDRTCAAASSSKNKNLLFSRSKSATQKASQGSSKPNSNTMTMHSRGFSQMSRPIKTVDQIFTKRENRNKFCMPLGRSSALNLELALQKERERNIERRNKRKQ